MTSVQTITGILTTLEDGTREITVASGFLDKRIVVVETPDGDLSAQHEPRD